MSATTPTGNVKLRMSIENVSMLALSIPLDKCVTFAVNPLKWLRFLGFAIYGQKGYLSLSNGGPDLDNYTAAIEARSYYFVSEYEPRLVDVDAADDRTSNASDLTIRRSDSDFRTDVVERDGTCVMTNDIVRLCTACHILPHAKGNNYISNVIRHRDGPDDINDINDTRNGLLLNSLLHIPFGDISMAFLKTPNFGLTVDDIPYNPPNTADEGPTNRLTLQHFVDSELGVVVPVIAPHNSDARQPQDSRKWPPAVIVDLIYAAAAMNAWSPKIFIAYIRDKSSNAYYPEGADDEDNGNVSDIGSRCVDARMGDHPTGQSGSQRYNLRSGNNRSNVPMEERRFDLLDGVLALWTMSSRASKKKTEDVHASSVSREGVEKWLESIEGPETN